MIGLEIEDADLRRQVQDILMSGGYIYCNGSCSCMDLVIVQGKNHAEMQRLISEDFKLILITDSKEDSFINYAYYALVKPIKNSTLLSLIKAMEIEEQDYTTEVSQLLLDVGVSPSQKGYQYLKDAVNLYINHKDFYIKEIYQLVGMLRQARPQNVERSIRYAIESAFDKCRIESQEKLFYNSIDPLKGKPTNMELICRIGDLIEINH